MAASHASSSASVIASIAPSISSHLLHLTPSPFSLPATSTPVTSLRVASSDPGSNLVRAGMAAKADGGLPACLLMRYELAGVLRLVPRLKELADLPVVLFISSAPGDYNSLLHSFRNSSFTLLHASSSANAMSLSAIASRTSRRSHKGVVVFFDETDDSPSGAPWIEKEIQEVKTYVTSGNIEGTQEEVLSEAFASLPDSLHAQTHTLTGSAHPINLVVALQSPAAALSTLTKSLPAHTGILTLTQYRPSNSSRLASFIPSSVEKVLVLEPESENGRKGTRWGPVFLDVVSAVAGLGRDVRSFSAILGKLVEGENVKTQLEAVLLSEQNGLTIGEPVTASVVALGTSGVTKRPKHESAYSNLLQQLFKGRIDLANAPSSVAPSTTAQTLLPPTNPEYALGTVLAKIQKRTELKKLVRKALADQSIDASLGEFLGKWLEKGDKDIKIAKEAEASVAGLGASEGLVGQIYELRGYFIKASSWIIGSEAWSHDLGSSGLHHALACGEDINLLLIDSEPYSPAGIAANPERRAKKDAGLYAMNYGEAYVASFAVYGDYSQAARALVEADKFEGPSIVVAYLPGGERDETSALEVLKETKRGIDAGYWPLYRWDPKKEADGKGESFSLDSERIKEDLREFLDRQNHLTQLSARVPKLAPSIEGGYAQELQRKAKAKAKEAYEKLAGAISGPPLLVLFASDGGNAEKVAKRLGQRARARGLGSRVLAMDDFPLDDLRLEPNVVFLTSTAGQGEFPQNGRSLWKHLVALNPSANGPNGGEGKAMSEVKYTVFSMGDSHYWPRPEDAHYYNKSGKDLDRRMTELGGSKLTEIGLGNDQDADGHQTGYKEWEPRLWKSLGVEGVEVTEAEVAPITNEHMKIASGFLRGTIKEGLQDTTTGAIAESDGQLTKFHGIYQQDDRDIREDRKEAGLEPAYSFMVRCRLPAGVCRPDQWLAIDRTSTEQGNDTFKLTTRQTFQFHGVIKSKLKPLIQAVNKAMMDTIAACGDVNRTVMCSPNPDVNEVHATVHALANDLSNHLLPKTSAYAEIWLDKKQVAGFRDDEPLYGPTYLPRKFKIAIAVPPHNDVDVHAHDLGYIAIVEGKEVIGYNVCVGGGMGVTHSMKTTYPRLSDVFGFVTPDQAVDFAEKVMTTQRDNGNRANRKNARVKYTVDRMGVEGFKAEVEKRLGWKLQPARPHHFDSNVDTFGWTKGDNGKEHFTIFIENGRVEDTPERPFKTGLREIAKVHKGVFRLTPNQHLILANVAPEEKADITVLLKQYKLDNVDFSGLRLSSSACVAFPTCGLAMAESERYLPLLVDKVEEIMEENGLRRDDLVMRMTGCPNGCARPWVAEVAFVGKAPGSYLMLLGGDRKGTRLNKPFREAVGEAEILELMRPMIKTYALERKEGEGFGDFTIRKGWIAATTHGAAFYDSKSPPFSLL